MAIRRNGIGEKIKDLRERRAKHDLPPLKFGVAGYAVVRETQREADDEVRRITDVHQSAAGYANYQEWLAGTQLEQRVSLEDYSVSNRGLRSGLVGTPERVAERIADFEKAGVDLVLLQFSPQLEEMEQFCRDHHQDANHPDRSARRPGEAGLLAVAIHRTDPLWIRETRAAHIKN